MVVVYIVCVNDYGCYMLVLFWILEGERKIQICELLGSCDSIDWFIDVGYIKKRKEIDASEGLRGFYTQAFQDYPRPNVYYSQLPLLLL